MFEQPRLYAPLSIQPSRSRVLAFCIVSSHAGALAGALLATLPSWLALVISLALGLSCLDAFRTHVWRTAPRALVAAWWDEQGQWSLLDAQGRRQNARLLGGSFVSVRLVILGFRLRYPWQRRYLVLIWDGLDAEVLRKVRVRLRLESAKGIDESAPGGV